jgi:hypothetical protein
LNVNCEVNTRPFVKKYGIYVVYSIGCRKINKKPDQKTEGGGRGRGRGGTLLLLELYFWLGTEILGDS